MDRTPIFQRVLTKEVLRHAFEGLLQAGIQVAGGGRESVHGVASDVPSQRHAGLSTKEH